MNNSYEIIIFDLDDTLIDNATGMKLSFEKILGHKGEKVTAEKVERFLKIDKEFWRKWESGNLIVPKTITDSAEKINWLRAQRFLIYYNEGITFDEAVYLNDIFVRGLGENVIPMKNARDIVKYLNNQCELYIATNGPKDVARVKLERIDVLEHISDIIAPEDCGYSKPMIEFFEFLFLKIDRRDVEKMAIIGDGLFTDIEGGIKVGMDTYWLDNQETRDTAELTPTAIITDLSDLYDLI